MARPPTSRRAGARALHASRRSTHKDFKTLALTAEARERLSDLQFTSAYRVPFQYSAYVREHLPVGAFLESSAGSRLTDLDGNPFFDLAGSYGLNVFGYEFYKACMAEGAARAAPLGPVLGAYHPAVAYNVRRLCEISGLDEVSFHMSGTEAVMQAVRLARYHTRRSHLVRFCGAYHGWWEDVQPGVGNPAPVRRTYTLKDMDEDSLRVLRKRSDIACVLVNPLQALHPNRAAPGDGSLVDSGRGAHFDRDAARLFQEGSRPQVLADHSAELERDAVAFRKLQVGNAVGCLGGEADRFRVARPVKLGQPRECRAAVLGDFLRRIVGAEEPVLVVFVIRDQRRDAPGHPGVARQGSVLGLGEFKPGLELEQRQADSGSADSVPGQRRV